MAELQKELSIDDFQLEVPKAVAQISVEQVAARSGVENAEGKVETYTKLEESVISNLNGQVDKIMGDLMKHPTNSAEMKDLTNILNHMGDKEIQQTSAISNRMLSRPIKGLRATSEGDNIIDGLKDLRATVVRLDPSQRDKLFSKNKFLSLLPFKLGGKIDSYFQEYKSSENAISDIINSLSNGRDSLIEDNAHIDEEREQMQDMMVRLEQYSYIMRRLDKKIEESLPVIEANDKMKVEDIRQEILFPVRQKRMDLQQHLAVSMQGYMALQVIKQNNKELIRGVERAKTTTTSALRTAIIVAEALGTQKLVLDQINKVNEVTDKMILQNSIMLKTQGVSIQKQAVESAVSVKTLEEAFKNIFQAMDAIDTYRAQALPQMQKTVESLEKTVAGAKNYLSSRREERIGNFAEEVMKETKEPETKGPGVVKIR